MISLVWCSLLIFSLSVTESIKKDESCLSQPTKEVWRYTGQNVVLLCRINQNCPTEGLRYEWLSFRENSHHPLKLQSHPQKYSLEGASLHIKSLDANDSGIYHCATVGLGEPAQGQQYVAQGTALMVREKVNVMARSILLWLSFVLLAIYSLALVTLIIKKHGCSKGVCRRMPKTQKVAHNSSADDIYQNV